MVQVALKQNHGISPIFLKRLDPKQFSSIPFVPLQTPWCFTLPGVGNDTWSMLAPEWPNFPSTGWDHWLRHGVPSLRFRDCVAPEVPRSKHVDNKGTNVKAGTRVFMIVVVVCGFWMHW